MITIICSTNRVDSITRKICETYSELLDKHAQQNQIIDLKDLPEDFTFSALYENSGKNESFNAFQDKIRQSEKYVFIVPEYNGSFPGVLKTFIDGLSYPSPFKNKKCALVGLSSGLQGAGLALSHLTDIFNYLGMHVLAYKPKLGRIEANTDDDNQVHGKYLEYLERQVDGIVNF